MTRVFVQRGTSSSSASSSSSSSNNTHRQSGQIVGDDVQEHVSCEDLPVEIEKNDEFFDVEATTCEKVENLTVETGSLKIIEEEEEDGSKTDEYQSADVGGSPYPPPPPAPPPKPSSTSSNYRRLGNSSRRATAWPVVSTRTSPVETRSSSPRSHCENDGYNSADEQNTCYGSSYGDAVSPGSFSMPSVNH